MAEVHSERAHARLSPSGAKRFMECPGSVQMEEGFEDKSSIFANEGTAAHELAQHCLETGADPKSLKGRVVDIMAETPVRERRAVDEAFTDTVFPIDDDMISAVTTYVDYVRWFSDKGFGIEIELRLDIGHVVDGMFGTGDLLAFSEEHKHLHVIDYKHGRGVAVDAEKNPQLSLYALGALKRYHNREIEKVTLTIVQPRASHPRGVIRSWETTPEALKAFGETVTEAAALADTPDAPLKPGDHCTFCKAAGVCPALRDQAVDFAKSDFEAVTANGATPDEMAEWLDKVSAVEIWCKKVREFANAQARDGNMPTGYKFVEKRATRKWSDEAKAVEAIGLLAELDDTDIFTPPALKSVAQIEKVVGKKNMGVLNGFIQKQSSGLVLAPDDDPREAAIRSPTEEFDEVAIED